MWVELKEEEVVVKFPRTVCVHWHPKAFMNSNCNTWEEDGAGDRIIITKNIIFIKNIKKFTS